VVDVIGPPELSTFIPSDDPAESPDSPDPAVPDVDFEDVSDVDESDVVVSVDPGSGPAHAIPGVVATATPTPKATAKPPTRPTYLA
jgi:hypothetical protein